MARAARPRSRVVTDGTGRTARTRAPPLPHLVRARPHRLPRRLRPVPTVPRRARHARLPVPLQLLRVGARWRTRTRGGSARGCGMRTGRTGSWSPLRGSARGRGCWGSRSGCTDSTGSRSGTRAWSGAEGAGRRSGTDAEEAAAPVPRLTSAGEEPTDRVGWVLSRPDGSGRGCRSWSCSRRRGRGAPAPCGCPARPRSGAWRSSAGRCGSRRA